MWVAVLVVSVFVLVINCVLLMLLVRRGSLQSVFESLSSIAQAQVRHEQLLREEFARNRTEGNSLARENREEMNGAFRSLADAVFGRMSEFAHLQSAQLETFSNDLHAFVQVVERKLDANRQAVDERLTGVTGEARESNTSFRTQMTTALDALSNRLDSRMRETIAAQGTQLESMATNLTQALGAFGNSTREEIERLRSGVEARLSLIQSDNSGKLELIRSDVENKLANATSTLTHAMESLSRNTLEQADLLRTNVENKLTVIQQDNSAKLEQMRATVDEKLHVTLEQRLGESFRLVSERLEQVHAGLGEMKTLASGVGDLKKVLTNIKVRGTWGEIQLGSLLEQMLTPDQYASNVQTNPDSGERVEFAIKLPGRDPDGNPAWLPIDSKFPQRDFERLIEAADQGDAVAVCLHGAALEENICSEAKKIREKYIHPPTTIDFAIMFLPTESLFAEILRRPGIYDRILGERVVPAGPTTLAALLSSLQMGFRTLAIEKRSSEVWNVLGAVKTEFSKFGDALNGVEKKLHEASNKLGDVHTRSRVLTRRLRDVQELPSEASSKVLQLNSIVIAGHAEESANEDDESSAEIVATESSD